MLSRIKAVTKHLQILLGSCACLSFFYVNISVSVFYLATLALAVYFFQECKDKPNWFKKQKPVLTVGGGAALFMLATLLWSDDFHFCFRTTIKLVIFVVAATMFFLWLAFFLEHEQSYAYLEKGTIFFLYLFTAALIFAAIDVLLLNSYLIKGTYQLFRAKRIYFVSYLTYYRWSFAATVLICPCVAWLFIKRRYLQACLVFLTVSWFSFNVDNDCAILGLVISCFAFVLGYLQFGLTSSLIKCGLVVFTIITPFWNHIVSPRYVFENVPVMARNTSYMHRLLILNWCANKIEKHPILGNGISPITKDKTHPEQAFTHDWLNYYEVKCYEKTLDVQEHQIKCGLVVFTVITPFWNHIVSPGYVFEDVFVIACYPSYMYRPLIPIWCANEIEEHPILDNEIGFIVEDKSSPEQAFTHDWLNCYEVICWEKAPSWQKRTHSTYYHQAPGETANLTKIIGNERIVIQNWTGKYLGLVFCLPVQPHNAIFYWWYSMGLLGALFYLATNFAVIMWIKKIKNRLFRSSCLAAFAAYTGASLINYGFVQSWWTYSLPIIGGIILIASKYLERPEFDS